MRRAAAILSILSQNPNLALVDYLAQRKRGSEALWYSVAMVDEDNRETGHDIKEMLYSDLTCEVQVDM